VVVLIHGLNASPRQRNKHVEAFKEKYGDKVAIFHVQVEKSGKCIKEEAVSKIQEVVQPYLLNNPKMKLYAHGISNGGRLASQLAFNLLQNSVDGSRMMVNANSSPLYGTKLMCDLSVSA
jgi:predicted esterase YcpF (UPF0227 family)